MRGGGGARPRGTGPRCVWTPRSLLGRDPDLGCAAVLGFLGHVSIHSLRHSDLHGHPTAQFCARACSRPCVRRLVSLAGAGGGWWGSFEESLRILFRFYECGLHWASGPHALPRPSRPRPQTATSQSSQTQHSRVHFLRRGSAHPASAACAPLALRMPDLAAQGPPDANAASLREAGGVPREGGSRRVQGHRELPRGAHPVPQSALLQSESETHGSVRSAPTFRRIDLKAPPTENCRPVRSGRNNPRDVQSPRHRARGAKGGKKGSDPQTLEPPPFPSGAC